MRDNLLKIIIVGDSAQAVAAIQKIQQETGSLSKKHLPSYPKSNHTGWPLPQPWPALR